MAVRRSAVFNTQGRRPDSVTVSAALAAVVGGGTLFGLFYLAAPLLNPTVPDQFTVIVIVLAVVQIVTGVLLFVGAGRFSTGAGRGMLFTGSALEFLVCAVYGWYAVEAVAGDLQDGGLFFVYFGIPCTAAVMTAGSVFLALRPSATAYVSPG